MSSWSVYKITNVSNSKCYIGITQKTLQKRLSEHFRDATSGRLNANGTIYALHAAINKYGKVVSSLRVRKWAVAESSAIKGKIQHSLFNAYGGGKSRRGQPRGYNQTTGGEMPDLFGASPKRKKKSKRSAASKNKKNSEAVHINSEIIEEDLWGRLTSKLMPNTGLIWLDLLLFLFVVLPAVGLGTLYGILYLLQFLFF